MGGLGKKIFNELKRHAYLYFLGIATAYSVFYTVYTFHDSTNELLNSYHNIIEYFSKVSILFFTAGIFTVAIKYLQFLDVFANEFERAISSDKFDKKLKEQLKQITFSKEFLLEQSNLPEIWKTVTLCKYNKQFKPLFSKIKDKLQNDLFADASISYYVKNHTTVCYFKLVGEKDVKIIEDSSFTIVAPNKKPIQWTMGFTENISDIKKSRVKLSYKIPNTSFEFNEKDILREEDGGFVTTKIIKELSGRKEYHIEQKIEVIQYIEIDRTFLYENIRILDDYTLYVKHCDKLGINFVALNNTDYLPQNNIDYNMAFKAREILLSGQKHIMFIYRKQTENENQVVL